MIMKKLFQWPAALTIIITVFIFTLIGFIGLSRKHKMDLVTKNYYKKEIEYQAQIDRVNRSQKLSSIKLRIDQSTRIAELHFPKGLLPNAIYGKIHLFRPSDASQDRMYRINLDPEGIQILDLKNLIAGFWRVKIYWQIENTEYYQEESIVLQ